MRWLAGLAGISSLVLVALTARSPQELAARYPRLESYEIRPGVLALPKYARDGTLCQVSIERLHVQPEAVELGTPTIQHKLVLEMIDELAPPSERGKATVQFPGSDYIDVVNGSVDIAAASYQNVSVQIYSSTSATGDVAAILRWKKEACSSFFKPPTPVR